MKLARYKSTVALLLAFSAALVVGCRNLKVSDKPVAGIVLPKAQMENDSVAVRVAVVELDDHQKTDFQNFIETTDQKLPLALKQKLDDNGVRVSVLSNVNISQLQKMLVPGVLRKEWLSGHELELAKAGKLEPVYRMASHRHVEKKRGQSFNVEVSPVRAESSWRIYVGERQIPDSAKLAQCHMRITSWPMADGSVKLQFNPEIHHGQNLSHISVDGPNFAVQQRRDIKELRSLAFEVNVQPGETIVVAPTEQLERIGELFFNASGDTNRIASQQVQDDPAIEDVDTSEFFPMLDNEELAEDDVDSLDASVLVEIDEHEDAALENRRPKPWQRFLMVRVVDVTAPAIP